MNFRSLLPPCVCTDGGIVRCDMISVSRFLLILPPFKLTQKGAGPLYCTASLGMFSGSRGDFFLSFSGATLYRQ